MGEFYELKVWMDRIDHDLGSFGAMLLMSLPWLCHFPFLSGTFNQIDRDFSALDAFLWRHIQKKIEQPNPEPQDFVDLYLAEMNKSNGDESNKYMRQIFKKNLKN